MPEDAEGRHVYGLDGGENSVRGGKSNIEAVVAVEGEEGKHRVI